MATRTAKVDPVTASEDALKEAFAAYIDTLSNAAMGGANDAPVKTSKAKAAPVDDDDDDDDEDGDEVSRDDLESESLPALKKMAKEAGYETADLRGLDKDGVIDLILGEGDEDEDEVDDDEEDDENDEEDEDEEDEDEEESEDDEEELTEDDLKAMPIGELRKVAKEYGVKVTPAMKKPAIVNAIMDLAE